MKCNNEMLKNKIGNFIFLVYFMMLIFRIILLVPKNNMVGILTFILGAIIGLSVRIFIIVVFWIIIMPRYITNNEVHIIQLIIGILLVELAFIVFGVRLFEMFIVSSIAIVLKKDYKIRL